jgi:flagellar motility protein MotE (MotC chaperone)
VKRMLNILMATLALNFILAAGAAVWVWRTAGVDRPKLIAIKELLFPKPPPAEEQKPAAPTTEPSATLKLDELVSRKTGGTAKEQVEFIQRAFDVQMAQLERKQRELSDLQRTIEIDKKSLGEREKALAANRKALEDQRQEASRLETDKGFQDSLELYNSMQAKQVKTIFMSLSDDVVVKYLEAMQPRTASRILKEFTKPEETVRVQKLMERMRQAQASAGKE